MTQCLAPLIPLFFHRQAGGRNVFSRISSLFLTVTGEPGKCAIILMHPNRDAVPSKAELVRSRARHICKTSSTSGCPCRPAFSSSTISMTASFWPSREISYANAGAWCSGTSAVWGFGSSGKRANSPPCRESLFIVWIRSQST